jgi:multidrug resistance efflux pump
MEEQIIKNDAPDHTEQIQDIIGTPPRWLHRWGITVMLIIATLCVLISTRISYPETIKTKLTIRSIHSPVDIAVKDSATLIRVVAANAAEVKKGDPLAILQTPAGQVTLKSTVSGKLSYGSIIHNNEQLIPGQQLFLIYADYTDFYAEIRVPENQAYKVKPGQKVLIKIRSTNDNQVIIKGLVRYILNDRSVNGFYLAEADFDLSRNNVDNGRLLFTNGMKADGEIITANATVFKRLVQSLTRLK